MLAFKPGKTTTSQMEKELVTKNPVTIRVYVIDCFNLPPKDANSESDPYIVIRLGKNKVDNADEYIDDNCNPKFYRMFTINSELPGAADLTI